MTRQVAVSLKTHGVGYRSCEGGMKSTQKGSKDRGISLLDICPRSRATRNTTYRWQHGQDMSKGIRKGLYLDLSMFAVEACRVKKKRSSGLIPRRGGGNGSFWEKNDLADQSAPFF